MCDFIGPLIVSGEDCHGPRAEGGPGLRQQAEKGGESKGPERTGNASSKYFLL